MTLPAYRTCLSAVVAGILFAAATVPGSAGIPCDSNACAASSSIDPWKLGLVVTGTAGGIAIAHLQSYSSFWKGERGAFRFREDGSGMMGMDKLGHLYASYVASDAVARALAWSGIDRRNAFLYGASVAFLFQLYVECEDAFTPSLGFSLGDAAADFAGSFYPVLQQSVHFFREVRFKYSLQKSDRFRGGEFRSIIDDYESQYHWLSIGVDRLIPEGWRSSVTAYFSVAIGYGVKKLDGYGGGEREVFVALDYNTEALPGEGDILRSIKHILNYVHLPSPMIRIAPSVVTYGLRF